MAHNHGKSDWANNEHVQRMAKSYHVRYDDKFWNALTSLSSGDTRDVIADFGCGPGLLLTDLANKFNAHTAIALDESEPMLTLAEKNLRNRTKLESIQIQQVNLDTDEIRIAFDSIDLAFSGFMLHEVTSPRDFVVSVYKLVKPNGVYIVYDFVSGNEDQFVKTMIDFNMSEDEARKRYPHMCKHSAEDIVEILEASGFSNCRVLRVDDIRAVAVGLKR